MCLPYLWTFHVCVIESSIIFQLCSFRVVHLTYLTLPSLIEVWPPRTQFSKIQTSFPRKILGERFMATPHGKESTNIPPTALGLCCFTSNIPLLRYLPLPARRKTSKNRWGRNTGLLAPPASQPASHPCHLWHCLEKRLLAQFRDSLKAPKRSCFCGLMPYQQLKHLASSQNVFFCLAFVCSYNLETQTGKSSYTQLLSSLNASNHLSFLQLRGPTTLRDVQFSPGFVEGFLLSLGASTRKNNKWLFLGICVFSKDLWWSLTSKKNPIQFKVIIGVRHSSKMPDLIYLMR